MNVKHTKITNVWTLPLAFPEQNKRFPDWNIQDGKFSFLFWFCFVFCQSEITGMFYHLRLKKKNLSNLICLVCVSPCVCVYVCLRAKVWKFKTKRDFLTFWIFWMKKIKFVKTIIFCVIVSFSRFFFQGVVYILLYFFVQRVGRSIFNTCPKCTHKNLDVLGSLKAQEVAIEVQRQEAKSSGGIIQIAHHNHWRHLLYHHVVHHLTPDFVHHHIAAQHLHHTYTWTHTGSHKQSRNFQRKISHKQWEKFVCLKKQMNKIIKQINKTKYTICQWFKSQ